MHEAFHGVIDSVARLPFEGEGGSLNEGFADFFAASMMENPNLGEVSYKIAPFKRTVKNGLKLQDQKGSLYFDSGIVSGLLWNLRNDLGSEWGEQIAWKTLLRLNPDSQFSEFKTELLEVVRNLPEEFKVKAENVLHSRGWID